MANLPRVLDGATQRGNDGETEENGSTAEQALEGLAATKGGGLPRVVEKRGQRAAINLVRRTVVATLHGDFLRQNALDVLHDGDAQRKNGQAGRKTQQRGVQGVPCKALFAERLVVPWPEQVDGKECQTHDDGQCSPHADVDGSALFGRISGDRETLLAERHGDAVHLSTQGGELSIRHVLELCFGVVLVYFAH